MKVLFLDQFSEMGGAQRALLDTVDAVQQRGWEAHAALPGSGPLVEQLRSRSIAVTAIPCGPYRSHRKRATDVVRFAFNMQEQLRVIRNLSVRVGFDLVYINGPRLLPAAALASRKRIPLLFHAHSHVPQMTAAKLAGWSIAHANATVVGCSNFVLEALRGYVGAQSHVIPTGVPDVGFRKRQFGQQKNWRIGIVGRISPEKGQIEFLEAAAQLAREFGDLRFVICGAPLFAENNYDERVRSLACGLPADFLGWRDDVAPVFQQIDVLVVPSKEEGMGRVLAEAFSAGVPVVAFPSGGIPELVTDGETGFLTSDSSANSLAARIREVLLMDPQALRSVIARARRKWENCYTVDRYQQHITAVLESLVVVSKEERENKSQLSRIKPQPQ